MTAMAGHSVSTVFLQKPLNCVHVRPSYIIYMEMWSLRSHMVVLGMIAFNATTTTWQICKHILPIFHQITEPIGSPLRAKALPMNM